VVYAGSFGPLQNLDTVLDAAQLLSGTDSRARFVLVGDGIEAAALRARAASLALSNVAFVPRRPPGQIRQMYAHAQALLVHLKDHPLSVGAIPQKVQAYLAAGRPIVIGANGEAAALVETAGAGVTCRAGSPEDLARAVRRLECLSEQQRDEMGRRGAAYYRQHLSFAKGCNRMDSIFRMAVSETVA